MANSNLPIVRKENIFQKLWNKLSKVFGKSESTIDPEPNRIVDDVPHKKRLDSQSFKEEYRVTESQLDIKPGSIEGAIDQFITTYIADTLETGTPNAYNSIIKLGALEIEEDEQNQLVERQLIDLLKEENQFNIEEQKNDDDITTFYHVATDKYEQNTNDDNVRIYINAKRKNVATLAGELLSSLQNENFYLKFSSDYQLSTRKRNEAIVIYTDFENIQNIMESVEKIQQKNPKLFDGSESQNPFLQNYGPVSVAPDPNTDTYVKPDGTTKKEDKSYNSFLSTALEMSFIESCKKIIAHDRELTMKTNGEISEDPGFYILHFEEIKEKHYREFLNSMKQELAKAKKSNPTLNIKGITEKGEQENER